MRNTREITVALASLSVAAGVFWAAWNHHGFWWGLMYGLFWHEWVGYRLAEYLLR